MSPIWPVNHIPPSKTIGTPESTPKFPPFSRNGRPVNFLEGLSPKISNFSKILQELPPNALTCPKFRKFQNVISNQFLFFFLFVGEGGMEGLFPGKSSFPCQKSVPTFQIWPFNKVPPLKKQLEFQKVPLISPLFFRNWQSNPNFLRGQSLIAENLPFWGFQLPPPQKK